jgi:purine-nucleoside phosphorylase
MGVLAVDMETAALYDNANRAGKKALSILTVSDHLFRDEHLLAEERSTSVDNMIKLALEIA